MKIKIVRLNKDVNLPVYKTDGSACMDLESAEDRVIKPNEIAYIKTGLIIYTPKGHVMVIAPRSSTPKRGLAMPHSVALVDPDYCGPEDETFIQLKNITDKDIEIKKGERTAQFFFIKKPEVEWEEIDYKTITSNKSRGGFGSTGH